MSRCNPFMSESFVRMATHAAFLLRASTATDDGPPAISPETACQAARAWRLAWEASGRRLPVPDACTGPDGQVFYSWDAGKDHLELEIVPGEQPYWFWSDRETGETGSEDWSLRDPLPERVVEKIGVFC